jgi:hypothetical protein
MDKKKFFILPIGFLVSTIIYISCCPKVDVSPFYKITGMGISTYGTGKAIVDTGSITNVDSIFLNTGFIKDCANNKNNPLSFLTNQSFALSCAGNYCGLDGLKNKVQSIKISSDSIYNGVMANSSLNQYFKLKFSSNSYISLDSMVTLTNENKINLSFLQFLITTKPANLKGHIFKFEILFSDNNLVSASTKRIFWN